MKIKTFVLCLLILMSASVCSAKNVVHQIEDSMPIDKWADEKFDSGDLAATVAGNLFYEFRF
ncbi:MAG: hypothetical protein K0R78_3390 [Pelosinus sp.]|jgi:hypothetical protein|nr:hypothetical protein [Pelosinus sp.]